MLLSPQFMSNNELILILYQNNFLKFNSSNLILEGIKNKIIFKVYDFMFWKLLLFILNLVYMCILKLK